MERACTDSQWGLGCELHARNSLLPDGLGIPVRNDDPTLASEEVCGEQNGIVKQGLLNGGVQGFRSSLNDLELQLESFRG